MMEFKQVKLHAQNQILLLKVLADEKDQVKWLGGNGGYGLFQAWRIAG